MDGGKPYELDVLSPIESTYRNDNLLYYPEAYQRLQETVRGDPELTLLDSNTHFTIISNKPLKIQAEFTLAEEGGDNINATQVIPNSKNNNTISSV